MTTRENTRTLHVGGVPVGGGYPVTIQSMTNTDTRNAAATIAQIHRLTEAGCEIVRVAVPDMAAAAALRDIKNAITLPLVADIHFDYRLALAAIENGADKLRLNPGNIGSTERVRLVAEAAKAAHVPIRIGVNAGSLEKDMLHKYNGVTAEGMAESALRHIAMLEDCGFYDIAVSLKASDVMLTANAHRLLAEQVDYPLHVGITEAGTPGRGSIVSAVGLGAILGMGIGDTIRVSLNGDPVEEVRLARDILQAIGLRRFGVRFIACPTCGRTQVNLAEVARKVEAFCDTLDAPLTVAVMGCAVNGPGEAREADIGVAGGRGEGLLFRRGEILRKVPEHALADVLIAEIKSMLPTV